MHPILGYPRRLGLYLIAWLSLSELLFYLVTYHSGIGWLESATFFFPLCLFYAFVCLSAWFSCRGIPLEESSFTGLLAPHLLASIIVSFLWVLVATALARGLGHFEFFHDFDQKITREMPLL